MNARAGDFLCRGEAGDIWPQKTKTLNERYVRTETVTAEGWRQYQPRPDAEGVMAFQVNHPFNVVTTWGQQAGKPGDYLLKNHRDRDVAEPVDVWIVDQRLFRATYEPVRKYLIGDGLVAAGQQVFMRQRRRIAHLSGDEERARRIGIGPRLPAPRVAGLGLDALDAHADAPPSVPPVMPLARL